MYVMKRAAALFLFAAAASAATGDSLLEQLKQQLLQARAMPAGATTSYRCPDNLDSLKGKRGTDIRTALGSPDFEQEGAFSYFLSSPVPAGQRGGGFPQITFHPTKDGQVERITCHYAR